MFNVEKINHIGIAVKSIEEAAKFWQGLPGLQITGTEVVESQKVKTAFIPSGDSEIELLEATDGTSTIAKFIEKNGEGVHHFALEVDNIEEALAHLKEAGIRLIDETPRQGAGGARIAFIHPKATGGILLELCQTEDRG